MLIFVSLDASVCVMTGGEKETYSSIFVVKHANEYLCWLYTRLLWTLTKLRYNKSMLKIGRECCLLRCRGAGPEERGLFKEHRVGGFGEEVVGC